MDATRVEDRRRAVARYRRGESATAIAASLGYSRAWVYAWAARGAGGAAAWADDRSRAPQRHPQAVAATMQRAVLAMRTALADHGVFCGPAAIRWALLDESQREVPAVRTIARILARAGVTPRRGPGRYQPKGLAYPAPPAVVPGAVHQTDFVGPCYLTGPVRFFSLHSVDLATGRAAVEPVLCRQAQPVLEAFWASWQRLGVPAIQQIDNEPVFYGNRARPRAFGPLIRLCLATGVEPWFIPVSEPWRNGVVERFNDWWQQRGPLRRMRLDDYAALQHASGAFEARHNAHARYSKLNGRTPNQSLTAARHVLRFPPATAVPPHPLPRPEQGRVHAVRMIRHDAVFDLFGERFTLPPHACYAYVHATIDVAAQQLAFRLDGHVIDERPYALR
jgi:hypothetical protein